MGIVAKKRLDHGRGDDVRRGAPYRPHPGHPTAHLSCVDATERRKTSVGRMTPPTTPSPERVPLALLSSGGDL